MSLATNLADLATRTATESKSLRLLVNGNVADLSALDTTATSDLVAAINEVFALAGSGGIDATELAALIHGATAKTSPVNADEFALIDSAAGNSLKRITLQNLATFITALIVDGSPGTLDTLNELAAAIGDDANFAATVTTALGTKQAQDINLTEFSDLVLVTDRLPYADGTDSLALATFTAAGRALLDDADVAAQRTTLSVYSQAQIGDPEQDLVAVFEAGLV